MYSTGGDLQSEDLIFNRHANSYPCAKTCTTTQLYSKQPEYPTFVIPF